LGAVPGATAVLGAAAAEARVGNWAVARPASKKAMVFKLFIVIILSDVVRDHGRSLVTLNITRENCTRVRTDTA